MEFDKKVFITVIITLIVFKIADRFLITPALAKVGMWENAEDAEYYED